MADPAGPAARVAATSAGRPLLPRVRRLARRHGERFSGPPMEGSMTMTCERYACTKATDRDERLGELLALHFHPRHGSRYWLRRQEQLGWAVCDRVRCENDLWLLGPTPPEDLGRFPLRDFIPQAFHGELHRFVVGETAGTSGRPRATAYRDDE